MKYDLLVSLGANCSVAHQLRRRFLRPFSLPFDWLCIDESRTFRWLADSLQENLSDFMLKENLVELKRGDPLYKPTARHVPYYDRQSGYRFLHLFNGEKDNPAVFEEARSTMRRRIDRLYSSLSSGNNCLVISTDVQVQAEHLIALEKSLFKVFPGSQFTIRMMQFASAVDTPEEECEKIGECVQVFRYRRKMNDYDWFQTNWEWNFLDNVQISHDVRRALGWRYRLWKHLGKSLT